MRNRFPAFLSVILLLVVEIINAFANIPIQQWDNFELISNILMTLIAVTGLFVTGIPLRQDKNDNLACILSNITVSAVAFPMNIDVFKHTIRPEQFLADLWGWHLWWIIFVVIQVLVLSTLGKNLLKQVQEVLIWARNTFKCFGSLISGLLDSLKKFDKETLAIMALGLILWIGYLYVRLYGNDMREVLSDSDFLWNNVVFWFVFLIIGLLIYTGPTLFMNIRSAVQKNPPIAWAILIIIIAPIIVPFVFPALWEILKILITILTIPVTLYAVLKFRCTKLSCSDQGSQSMHPADICIVISAFTVPLLFIFLLGAFTPDGRQLFDTPNLSDTATFLEFLGIVADAANNILQLLGLK